MITARIHALGWLPGLLIGAAMAQSPPKDVFSFTPIKIDSSREARPTEWYLEGRSELSLKGSLADYMSIDPLYLYLDKRASPIARQIGEDTQYSAKLPSGYVYCGTRVRLTSAIPSDGPRAAKFSVHARPQGLEIATWTPSSSLGRGRSWIEADIQLIGVKSDFLQSFVEKGICARSREREIISCEGRRCSGIEDGQFEGIGQAIPLLKKTPN